MTSSSFQPDRLGGAAGSHVAAWPRARRPGKPAEQTAPLRRRRCPAIRMRWCWAPKSPCSAASICEASQAYVRAAQTGQRRSSWPSRRRAWPTSISNGRWCMDGRRALAGAESDQRGGASLRGVRSAASVSDRPRGRASGRAARHRVHQSAGRVSSRCCRSSATKARRRGATAVLQTADRQVSGSDRGALRAGAAAVQSDNFALALEHAQKARELGPLLVAGRLLLAQVQMLTRRARRRRWQPRARSSSRTARIRIASNMR